MAYFDYIVGRQSWSGYFNNKDLARQFDESLARSTDRLAVRLDATMREEVVAKGLGALDRSLSGGIQEVLYEVQNVSAGIDGLRADFNLLMGDVVWKLEQQNRTLQDILDVLQAPLDTVAKELRNRAEDAYLNGWYEEALKDFRESAEKNYQDFSVHRSLGNIFLYHLIDLDQSLLAFQKAAKYARPRDARQAAEAEFFVGIVYALQQKHQLASERMQEAFTLNPSFSEAYYMFASFEALLGHPERVLWGLERAIAGDPRYHPRAWSDECFAKMQSAVRQLLERLAIEKRKNAEQAHQRLEKLAGAFDTMEDLRPERESSHEQLGAVSSELAKRTFVTDHAAWVQSLEAFESLRKGAITKLTREYDTQAANLKRKKREMSEPNRGGQGAVQIMFGVILLLFCIYLLLDHTWWLWTLFISIPGAIFVIVGLGLVNKHSQLKASAQRFQDHVSRLGGDRERLMALGGVEAASS